MRGSNRITALVTGVGSCGVGEGVAKALLGLPGYRLLCANLDASAPLLYDAEGAFLLPRATDPDYVDCVVELCTRNEVQALIPGSEAELRVLCRHRNTFETIG